METVLTGEHMTSLGQVIIAHQFFFTFNWLSATFAPWDFPCFWSLGKRPPHWQAWTSSGVTATWLLLLHVNLEGLVYCIQLSLFITQCFTDVSQEHLRWFWQSFTLVFAIWSITKIISETNVSGAALATKVSLQLCLLSPQSCFSPFSNTSYAMKFTILPLAQPL